MPTTPARELSITYGSYTCSPDGQHSLIEDGDLFTLTFSFNIANAASEAAFAAACLAARDAFRTPYQKLTLTQGSMARVWDSAASGSTANTGLETRSRITKDFEHVANTGRSRHFTVEITGGQPANNVTTSGLREFSVNQSKSPAGRKLVVLSGVFTAVGTDSARTRYEAAIGALETATLTALGLTLGTDVEMIGEDPAASSYHDQTIAFSRTYHQIKFGQAGGRDDAAIVEQQVTLSVRTWAERNAPSGVFIPRPSGETGTPIAASGGRALPLVEVTATYDAWLAFASISGVSAMSGKWQALRTWVFGLMQQAAGGGAFAVTSETPSFNPDDNRITASVSAICATRGGCIRREFSQQTTDSSGKLLVSAWTGVSTACYEYDGPRVVVQVTRLLEEIVSGGTLPPVTPASATAEALGSVRASIPQVPGMGIAAVPVSPATAQTGSAFGSQGDNFGSINLPPNSITEQDDTTSEPEEFGTDVPIVITRTTRVRRMRYFTRVGQPAGFAKTGA